MCFSATASFSLGAALIVISALSLQYAKKKSLLPFAGIPFFFGLQQLAEGAVWVGLMQQPDIVTCNTYVYLFFALLFWPLYIPFCMWILEKNSRAKVMVIFLAIAVVYTACILPAYFHASAELVKGHIYYAIPITWYYTLTLLYCLATIGPFLVAGDILLKLFGIAGALAFAMSYWIFTQWAVSVWCFFSAILSILIVFIVKHLNQKK